MEFLWWTSWSGRRRTEDEDEDDWEGDYTASGKFHIEILMAASAQIDWSVTAEKVSELVRRIVSAADPLEVIAFGSRARGDHREDSDLDLAVIVEDEQKGLQDLRSVRAGIRLEVDLLVFGKERFERFRPWINTVQREIDREGVRLYERCQQPSDPSALDRVCARRALASV